MLLIYPPHAKNCEPPAGIALLAGSLRAHGHPCTVCDMNSEALEYLVTTAVAASDTWSRRAFKDRQRHQLALQDAATYTSFARYQRSVADLNRIVEIAGRGHGLTLSLANYQDRQLSPQNSADLLVAAANPETNIYFPYFRDRLNQLISTSACHHIGFSLNYLSQALCTFAMIGLVRRNFPEVRIVLGGGLVTTWLQHPNWHNPFIGLVDQLIAGKGEEPLLQFLGIDPVAVSPLPDYHQLRRNSYWSPGFCLPYASSRGCFWQKCSFCPETSEKNPYLPLSPAAVSTDLRQLTTAHQPVLLHFLDNALSPAMLRRLAAQPPGPSWYGFVRFSAELIDEDFCRQLRRSGCTMLKLGLESGSQRVLDELTKGIRLEMVGKALAALHKAGIGTYVYLLFGTPAESEQEARETLQFVQRHHQEIGFLNLAIFNLPICSREAAQLAVADFYQGDLSIYLDFQHPRGWNRKNVRRFLDSEFKKDQAIQQILRRDPPHFTSNHAPFFC